MNAFESLKSIIPLSARIRIRSMLERARGSGHADYERRLQQEQERFAVELNISDLPPIFTYWANKHLRPMVETFGFSYPEDFYAKEIARRAASTKEVSILSIGSGNCDTEVRVAKLLVERGLHAWRFTCVDLTPEMLERGRAEASDAGLSSHFEFVVADFNKWPGTGHRYELVLANQCLHHVLELETLFDRIPEWLVDRGAFVTSDMIGRNGHQRWPEARTIVDEFWSELPEPYRYNRALRRQETQFLDWDCSAVGFEGIRSQDILPLMCKRFGFEFFFGFGNVIDPFTDRSFGWNFNEEADWDRNLIDRIHARDELEMDAGRITPTHMMATLTLDRTVRPILWKSRTPEASIRPV